MKDVPALELRLKKEAYTEDGMYVMTEGYHLERGFCCGSGCRHCPFWPKYQKGNKTIKDEIKKLIDR